jgi:hypothetical protein
MPPGSSTIGTGRWPIITAPRSCPRGYASPATRLRSSRAVNTINKRVIGYLLDETWTSLAELNEAIAERVHEINHELRRADGSTRFERFTAEEAPMLSPLPDEAFEQVDWRAVKAARN